MQALSRFIEAKRGNPKPAKSGLSNAKLTGADGRLCAVPHVELGEDVRDVVLDGALGKAEPIRNLLVRRAAPEQRHRFRAPAAESGSTNASAFGPPDSINRAKAATTRPVTVLCRNDSPRVAA